MSTRPPPGCPSDTLYDITTRTSTVRDIPGNTELCLPKKLGEQTAIVFDTSTIRVNIANPDVATCPPNTVKVDVTSNQQNVDFTTVCVHTAGPPG